MVRGCLHLTCALRMVLLDQSGTSIQCMRYTGKSARTGHQDAEARKQDGCAISRSWEPASKVTERQGNVPGNAGLGRRGAALGNYLYLFWLRWLHNK